MATSEDRDALLVLLHLATLTARRLLELATIHPSASTCLQAVLRGEAGSDGDRAWAGRVDPRGVAERLRAAEARFIASSDPEYPAELLDLFDPPAGLFVRGRPLGETAPRVAVVGARNCSPAGAEIARSLATTLAGAGVCVVSGAARGIDARAHEGALRGGGASVAVLGSGIDQTYPRKNRDLVDAIAHSGAVVSEYPPGTPAEPFRFPARNRIVAALSRAVVVVEGAVGSGSLITAEHALDLGRDVFAVPGAPSTALAHVPLTLIRDGATLIRGPQDLLDDLGLSPQPQLPQTTPTPVAGTTSVPSERRSSSLGRGEVSAVERAAWEALTSPATADRIAQATALPLPAVLAAMVGLELRRLVVQVGGRYERRPGAECC